MPRLFQLAARTLIPVAVAGLLLSGCSGPAGAEAGPATSVSAAVQPSASPSTVAPSPSVSAAPAEGAVELSCVATQTSSEETVFTVTVDAKGRYDFRKVWKTEQFGCDVTAVEGRATEKVTPTTALQKSVYQKSGYVDADIAELFSICGQVSSSDPSVSGYYSMDQDEIKEYTGALALCPAHPYASGWRRTIAESREDLEDSGDDIARGVHPGAFCTPTGAQGYTAAGTLMECTSKSGDSRARWRRLG